MENQVWIIKDQLTGHFFTLLGGKHFSANLEIAQRFNSESDAILCEEQEIHNDITMLDYESIPAELMINGMTVKYRTPDEGEEELLFTVVDASDQDRVFIQAVNSTLALPPVEALNSVDLTVIRNIRRISITRILDIPKMDFPDNFTSQLEFCAAYSDNVEQQDIYNSFDLLENGLFDGVFSEENQAILKELEELCVANDCTYFRLTY